MRKKIWGLMYLILFYYISFLVLLRCLCYYCLQCRLRVKGENGISHICHVIERTYCLCRLAAWRWLCGSERLCSSSLLHGNFVPVRCSILNRKDRCFFVPLFAGCIILWKLNSSIGLEVVAEESSYLDLKFIQNKWIHKNKFEIIT